MLAFLRARNDAWNAMKSDYNSRSMPGTYENWGDHTQGSTTVPTSDLVLSLEFGLNRRQRSERRWGSFPLRYLR